MNLKGSLKKLKLGIRDNSEKKIQIQKKLKVKLKKSKDKEIFNVKAALKLYKSINSKYKKGQIELHLKKNQKEEIWLVNLKYNNIIMQINKIS